MATHSSAERPLLCRPALLPDESLWSYLSRLADANAYASPVLLTRLCARRLAVLGLRDNLLHPQRPETFSVLAGLTHLAPRALANTSLHAFTTAPLLQGARRPTIYLADGTPLTLLDTFSRSRYMLPPEHAQFCPDCLREGAYHRRTWILSDVSVCLEHRRVLLNRCPDCGKSVPVRDVVRCQCGQCGASFTRVEPEGWVTPFGAFAQSVMCLWWGFDPTFAGAGEWTLLAQPFLTLHFLFRFLMERLNTDIRRNQGVYLRSAQRHRVQRYAMQLLSNWPVEFEKFLYGCLKHDVRVQSTYAGEDFYWPVFLQRDSELDFLVQRFWEEPDFWFIREALSSFFAAQNLQLCREHGRLHLLLKANKKLRRMARRLSCKEQRRRAQAVERL